MKVLKLNALAEIQLLTGAIPSIILPLVGFWAAAIQKRFRKNYQSCLITKEITDFDDDGLMTALRLM